MRLRIEFRALPSSGCPIPEQGVVFLVPRERPEARHRGLATIVLRDGVAALIQGPGPVEVLVVPTDPCLDDMVAALVVQELLDGRQPSPGLENFTRYAGLSREGLAPGEAPLATSLAGVFLAMRREAGRDLEDRAVAARFLESWHGLARFILESAAAGKTPFAAGTFTHEAFGRELAFLARDEDVYRQDVRRGHRWLITMPGGPALGSGLVLREPRSLLWKHWSRVDRLAPVGDAYLFLGVNERPGRWVFSTDPVQRLPLDELAGRLQEAEARVNPAAAADPWFDGQPFGHTLVGAPRGGSALPDDAVLGIVRDWLHARPVPSRPPRPAAGWRSLAAMAVSLAVAAIGVRHFSQERPPNFRGRGPVLDSDIVRDRIIPESTRIPGYAVIVGVGRRQKPSASFGDLPAASMDATAVYTTLRDRYGFDADHMHLLVEQPDDAPTPVAGAAEPPRTSGPPTRANVDRALMDIAMKTATIKEGRANFVFFFSGHGDKEGRLATASGYLVLSGYDGDKPGDRRTTGYDMEDLPRHIARDINASHRLILLDCCYSGFAAQARGAGALDAPGAIFAAWGRGAQIVLTAGTTEEQALESRDRGSHGLFTGAVLEAVGPDMSADANRDRVVTDGELACYLQDRLSARVAQIAPTKTMTPQYTRGVPGWKDDVGQFLFIAPERRAE